MSKRVTLPELKIASPCPARWDEMCGDDRRRFCESCGKHVHNFAEMRDTEILDVLRGESVCAQLYQRADGTILTADCSIGVRLARSRFGKSTVRAAGFVIATFGTAIYAVAGVRIATLDRVTETLICQRADDATTFTAIAGDVAMIPPATQPIRGEIAPTIGKLASGPTTSPSD